MGNENKIRDAADAIKGIAEAVPVYQDAIQPAAKEIGSALQTVAKTVHVALAPLSVMVWGYERISDYLEKALTERLKEVPTGRIVTPNPSIACPAVEALRFTAHEPALRELYANLLASAMDSKTADQAHPAFVEIIKQMTPDEALIGKLLLSRSSYPAVKDIGYVTDDHVVSSDFAPYRQLIVDAGTRTSYVMPCLENLTRLGLIRDAGSKSPITIDVTEPEKDLKVELGMERFINDLRNEGIHVIDECKEVWGSIGDLGATVSRFYVMIGYLAPTALGAQFYKSCIEERKGER